MSLTPLEQAAYKEAIKDHFRENLFAFAKYCLGYKDITKNTHGELIECLERPTKRKLIVMPRGTFKSSIACVAFPIWCLIKNPNLRILIDSEVYSNSKNFLREIKQHLKSNQMIELFGEFESSTWNESEIIINQRTTKLKEASITVSGIGAVKVGQHYDIIIGDDYNSGNNSETPEMREKVIRHYQLNTAILEPTGTYVVVGTRYAVDDLIGTILDNEVKDA